MSEDVRGPLARAGIAGLNLLLPGLGLLRLGLRRQALAFMAAPLLVLLLVVIFYALTPRLAIAGWAAAMALAVLAMLVIWAWSIALSWRRSRNRDEALPWWRRWYALVLWIAAGVLAAEAVRPILHAFYKPFYLPAESMAPTLAKGDKLIAKMGPVDDLGRGDIILLAVGESVYIKRVAALPGDRIAMRSGVVILNGMPVAQRFLGKNGEMRRLAERFPGEASDHEIYDMGPSPLDDQPEIAVPPGHLFVLGDNRDRSADSRVPNEEMGVELLPVERVRGRALFRTFGPSGRMGEALGR